jgi:hypothetical protein
MANELGDAAQTLNNVRQGLSAAMGVARDPAGN